MGARAANSKPFDIDRLFDGYLRLLQTDAEYFSRLTKHNAELGRMNETHLVKLLRRYLPAKFGIGTGFIQCGGDRPEASPQCDIVIYDAINNAPFYSSDTWSLFPIEIVYGVIEVKTTLDGSQLKNAFKKCKRIRAMAEKSKRNKNGNKSYQYDMSAPNSSDRPKDLISILGTYHQRLAPRFFIFGYRGFKDPGNFRTSFQEATNAYDNAHVHGACCLNDESTYYVRHEPYREASNRVGPVLDHGFRRFLRRLPPALDSMLPPSRRGLFFDRVDLDHYESEQLSADGGRS